MQYLQILIPVVNAVIAFPFGQDPNNLIGEVAGRLVDRARQMSERLFPDLEGASRARAELGMLRSVANLYAQCHFAEMTRLMSMNDQQREGQSMSMDSLWEAFDERMAMIETLAAHIAPADKPADDNSAASQDDMQQNSQHPPSSQGEEGSARSQGSAPPKNDDQDSQAQQDQQDNQTGSDDGSDDGSFNPMAFFTKDSDNDEND